MPMVDEFGMVAEPICLTFGLFMLNYSKPFDQTVPCVKAFDPNSVELNSLWPSLW